MNRNDHNDLPRLVLDTRLRGEHWKTMPFGDYIPAAGTHHTADEYGVRQFLRLARPFDGTRAAGDS